MGTKANIKVYVCFLEYRIMKEQCRYGEGCWHCAMPKKLYCLMNVRRKMFSHLTDRTLCRGSSEQPAAGHTKGQMPLLQLFIVTYTPGLIDRSTYPGLPVVSTACAGNIPLPSPASEMSVLQKLGQTKFPRRENFFSE